MAEEDTKKKADAKKAEEPKKVEDTKKTDDKKKTTSAWDDFKAIDTKYDKSIADRNKELYIKNKIEANSGTSSKTKIAGLRGMRGLNPRLGTGIKTS